jgi:5-methyltetrahydrofolate--homocysteine methyltransferase
VRDASLAVEVCSRLLQKEKRIELESELKVLHQKNRDFHEKSKASSNLLNIEEARARKLKLDWKSLEIPTPEALGVQSLSSIPLKDVIPYIDWTPFFWAWELKGVYPKILSHAKWGVEAKKLFEDGQVLLKRIVDENLFEPKATFGFWKARSKGDDVQLLSSSGDLLETLCFLRQQAPRQKSEDPQYCLADFVAPADSGRDDYLGAFVVTAGKEVEALSLEFEQMQDDYSSIMVKALGDRIAEAMAEWLHQKVRVFWGYGKSEDFTNEDLIAEKYQGIRPAPGYPACPDHTEKLKLFQLLEATKHTGVSLTESMAMTPASSVSGYYFSNSASRYSTIGKITDDQLLDYARRKGWSEEEARRWLAPLLF